MFFDLLGTPNPIYRTENLEAEFETSQITTEALNKKKLRKQEKKEC